MIINKLDNKTYDPSEITYIAQLEIRSHLSQAQEDNLQRKITGSLLGIYTLSTEEQQEVNDYAATLLAVQAEAAQAVIDNQLVIDAIAYENAVTRLQQTVENVVYNGMNQTTETVTNPLIEQDEAERAAAQTIIDNASAEVLALVELRVA